MIDNALFLLDPRLRRAGVRVELELPPDGTPGEPVALCDANRLEQVLVNLLANGLDSVEGRAEPRLRVAARRTGGGNGGGAGGERVVVSVADSGPGLPADVLPRLFEPFFTTKAAGGGLGLGLAISAGIVRDFGGTLTGSNGPDGGAVFTVELPAAPPPPSSPLPPPPSAHPTTAALADAAAGDTQCPTPGPQS
ncbi:sensor histidine kinase [Azospirillum thermophilum]|uniref:sensor histidine kinase n=1 Tax=Azospirillum thermophilum TaxID=2202148 RepID=UPI001B3B866D|nr:ATP-binding protein [Azospirillum thermophilum]